MLDCVDVLPRRRSVNGFNIDNAHQAYRLGRAIAAWPNFFKKSYGDLKNTYWHEVDWFATTCKKIIQWSRK